MPRRTQNVFKGKEHRISSTSLVQKPNPTHLLKSPKSNIIMATPEPTVTAAEQAIILEEIWDLTRGNWKVFRHDYTDVALNGQNIPLDSIRIPAEGQFKIIPRAPTDPDYEDEVLKTSAVHYRARNTGNTHGGDGGDGSDGNLIGTQGERYVFRRRKETGVWSIWDSGAHCMTRGKVADFKLKNFYRGPIVEDGDGKKRTYRVVLDVTTWNDEFGKNFLQMVFIYLKGIEPDYGSLEWELRCRFDDHLTSTTRQWEDRCTFVDE
jgi:hypothetical protein